MSIYMYIYICIYIHMSIYFYVCVCVVMSCFCMGDVTHMNESYQSQEKVKSYVMNESCHSYAWVMSPECMGHVSLMNASSRMSRLTQSGWVRSLTWFGHVTQSCWESFDAYEWELPLALQHTAAHCNTLQYTATYCNESFDAYEGVISIDRQHTATQCSTQQHMGWLRIVGSLKL